MSEKFYTFSIEICGYGEDAEKAFNDAREFFNPDELELGEVTIVSIEELNG